MIKVKKSILKINLNPMIMLLEHLPTYSYMYWKWKKTKVRFADLTYMALKIDLNITDQSLRELSNSLSHRHSQARFWDTLCSWECSVDIVNQVLRSKSWRFPYEGPQTRIFTKQPCNSIQSGRKTMNYEDKCIKGAWNWSVFPQIMVWLSNPVPPPHTNKQTNIYIHSQSYKEKTWVLGN